MDLNIYTGFTGFRPSKFSLQGLEKQKACEVSSLLEFTEETVSFSFQLEEVI